MTTMGVHTVYSHDDGGWYCEVFDAGSGATLHTTAVYKGKRLAVQAAQLWISKQE